MNSGQSFFFEKPVSSVELNENEIHIWSALLRLSESCYERLYETLSSDERSRAERFIFEKDKRRFAASRGILRNILACYLHVAADDICFVYGKNGKPALDQSPGGKNISFNVSHSEEVALFAFAKNVEVGVDVEFKRDLPGMKQIAERSFSIKENEVFQSLSANRQKEAFFQGWTYREAYIKALGDGLARPLEKISISFDLNKPSPSITINDQTEGSCHWFIKDVSPAPDYRGALAVVNYQMETKYWQWKFLS